MEEYVEFHNKLSTIFLARHGHAFSNYRVNFISDSFHAATIVGP